MSSVKTIRQMAEEIALKYPNDGYAYDIFMKGYRQAEADAAELVEGLRRVILWAECASAKMESRENINWTYLNDGRAALAKWRERGV